MVTDTTITTGRVKVLVTNIGKELIVIDHGMKFARIHVEPVFTFEWLLEGTS